MKGVGLGGLLVGSLAGVFMPEPASFLNDQSSRFLMFERIGKPDSDRVLHYTVYGYERCVRGKCDAISDHVKNVLLAAALPRSIVFGPRRVMSRFDPIFERSPQPTWVNHYV